MAHQIYQEKFLSYRQPAWHQLGMVVQEMLTATEAAEQIRVPAIITEPVVTASGLPTQHKAIIGETDPRRVYSVVTTNYREITHMDFVQAWDRRVKQNIETIGVLMKGAGLFMSAKLPSFSVKGDEMQAYILAENWLTGTRATKVRKTPVRVVCMNTLQMSDAQSMMELRVPHNQQAVEALEENLATIIEKSIGEYRAIREVFEILAGYKAKDEEVRSVFEASYPTIKMPERLLSRAHTDDKVLDELAKVERNNGIRAKHRDECFRLYAGEGLGCQSQAANGTLWGAYNAVAEYEQYVKDNRQPESIAFGAGKDRVTDAFTAACALAGVNAE